MTTLILPWPPSQLTPNFKRKNHWTAYSGFTKKYRADCKLLASQIRPTLGGRLPITIVFYPPDNRKRDRDGMISAFKAGQDGLSDAWQIDDNLFDPTYKFGEVKKHGAVEVTI